MTARSMGGAIFAIGCLVAAVPAAASEVGCPARIEVPEASATFYVPEIEEGACSLPFATAGPFAAVSIVDFAGSAPCGRCARVTGPLGSVVVRIVDACTSLDCPAGHLDLDAASFAAIGDPELGILPIAWETVACDVGTDTMQLVFENSQAYYLKVQVRNHRYGIAAVEIKDGGDWLAMARSIDNHFVLDGAGAPYEPPFSFRITDVHGQAVETGGIPLANDVPLETGVQLAVVCPEADAIAAALGALFTLRARRRS